MQGLFERNELDKLDRAMILAISVLVLLGIVIVLRGDQLGATVQSYGPVEKGASRPIIRVRLDDPVQANTVAGHLSILPDVQGKIAIVGDEITFQPNTALLQDQTYQVRLSAGVQTNTGRSVKQDIAWSFRVRPPRLAYLGPADNPIQNLFIVDLTQPDSAKQLTQSTTGIVGYDVSPDGSSIVYTEFVDKGATNLRLLDLNSDESRLLQACKDALCSNPVFSPDGRSVAFEWVALNSGSAFGPSASRVWVLDVKSDTSRPLFDDQQKISNGPHWSPDGKRLAVYNLEAGGIVVYDLATKNEIVIPTPNGEVGQFSSDGYYLTFPKTVPQADGGSLTHQVIADLTSPYLIQSDLVPDSDSGDYKEPLWLPDNKHLVVLRPSVGAQLTGVPQIFIAEVGNGIVTPVVEDQSYSQNGLALSPAGDVLLFQRFLLTKPGARPELWIYNFATHELRNVVQNGGSGKWVP